MTGYASKTSTHELPSRQVLRYPFSRDTPRPELWVDETIQDLNELTLEQPDLVFPASLSHQDDEFYEYHFTELFVSVQTLSGKVFGGGEHQHFCRKRSPWSPEYPDEFYEHVKAVAHPDPNSQQWESLVRDNGERIMLINGIVWKVLHANVLSSLMFGAGEDHEKALSTHDDALMDVEGFARSKLLAETNAAYLDETPYFMPPNFWERVREVSSQILKMLLPLYNVCGYEFSDKPPALEDFAQAVFNIVAYAGWLNLTIRLSSGVLNISWSGPGLPASNDEKMVLEEVFTASHARAKSKDDASNQAAAREKRIKISAAPSITRFSLDEEKLFHHKVYLIQQPHVIYYSALKNEREHLSLADHVASVRRAEGLSPTWLVLLIMVVAFNILLAAFVGANRI